MAVEVISPTLFKSLTPDPHFSPGHCGLSSAQLSSEQPLCRLHLRADWTVAAAREGACVNASGLCFQETLHRARARVSRCLLCECAAKLKLHKKLLCARTRQKSVSGRARRWNARTCCPPHPHLPPPSLQLWPGANWRAQPM